MEHRTKHTPLRHWLAVPFLWMLLIPFMTLDLLVEIYHRVCFPLYGLPYVKRSEYIRIMDRTKLSYLTIPEKFGCAYCGYINGWLHYTSIIAAKTEHYWCGIAHLEGRGYCPAVHEDDFVKFGDEKELRMRHAKHDLEFPKP